MKLTKAGRLLYDQAVRMLRELEDLQTRARHVEHELAGSLTVGTYESLAEYLWPDFLLQLQESSPHLHLSIKTSLHQDPIGDLLAGKIDLLVDAEPQVKSALISWPLYDDRFAFYVAVQRAKTEYTTRETAMETILYVEKAFDENRVTIEDHLETAGHRFARQYCFDSFSTTKRLALKGMGIAVLPTRLAHEDATKKRLKRVQLEGFARGGFGRHTLCATTRSENAKDLRIKKIIALLKRHFKTGEGAL